MIRRPPRSTPYCHTLSLHDAFRSLAEHNINRQAAARRFLVFAAHVGAGLAHGLDDGIQGHMVLAVALQGKSGCVDGLDGSHGIAFDARSEEHTSELQSLMRISYAVFCL